MDATVIAAAIVTVITSLTAATIAILGFIYNRKAVGEAKVAVVEAKTVAETVVVQGQAQAEKLTTIAKSVDGGLRDLLQQLADSRAINAAKSGTDSDKKLADDAQRKADDQAARVDASDASDEKARG